MPFPFPELHNIILTPRPMPLLARHGPDLPLHWRGCEGQGHCEDPAQLRPGLRLVRGGGVSGPGSSSSYKGGQKMIPLLRPNVLHWAATHGEGDRFSYYDDGTARTVATTCMFGGGQGVW